MNKLLLAVLISALSLLSTFAQAATVSGAVTKVTAPGETITNNNGSDYTPSPCSFVVVNNVHYALELAHTSYQDNYDLLKIARGMNASVTIWTQEISGVTQVSVACYDHPTVKRVDF